MRSCIYRALHHFILLPVSAIRQLINSKGDEICLAYLPIIYAPMFHPLTFLLFLLTIPLAHSALTLVNNQPISCGHLDVYNVNPIDCLLVLTQIQTRPWYNHITTFGKTQPPPGTTPILEVYQTCTFQIFTTPDAPDGFADQFLISHYANTFSEIVAKCWSSGQVFNWGGINMGPRQKTFAYLGGRVKPDMIARNGTMFEEVVRQTRQSLPGAI